MTPKEILQLPYHRCFVPDVQGGYTGYILEFPGCLAEGDTLEETYEALEDAAADWIAAALDLGQDISVPIEKIWKKGE